MGATTRLYLAADDSSFTDVPTEEITGYEKDLSIPVPPPASSHASVPASSVSAKSEFARSGSVKSGPAPPLNEVVNIASAAYHLDPDLVNSVIHAESGFNAHAVSPKGARGLMQLMPGTASQLGVNDCLRSPSQCHGRKPLSARTSGALRFRSGQSIGRLQRGSRARRAVSGSAAISRNPRLRGPHRARIQHQEDRPGKSGETKSGLRSGGEQGS